ncbi:MAG: hypothetical protein SGPRY_015093 [Prymnesium sp.]
MEDIKGAGDGLWRKEHKLIAPHLADAADDFNCEPDSTWMSERSFGRNAAFSTPIEECLKDGYELGWPTDKYFKPE